MSGRDPLDDFTAEAFTFAGRTRTVHRRGEGPGVVVITEVPGITPEVADFARHVVDAGFTVAMPDLFGDAGRPASLPYMTGRRSPGRACRASSPCWHAGGPAP